MTCVCILFFPQCLTIVLDNALCHPLLEKLLPTVKYSLHDTSEKVRAAFLDMLIKVKAVRAAKVCIQIQVYQITLQHTATTSL